MRKWTFGFHKIGGISWQETNRVACKEGPCSMEKLVFSVVETELRKVFIPQQHSKSVMNTFLPFTLILTSYLHSFYNWILTDNQSIVESFWHSIYNVLKSYIQSMTLPILTFSLLLAPYWYVVWYWPLIDIQSIIHSLLIFSPSFTPNWYSVYHSLLTNIQSIIHSLLTFSPSFIPYWHSAYHSLLTDIQSIIHSLLIFSLSFTPYWHSVYHSLLTDIQSTFTPYWHSVYHSLRTDIQSITHSLVNSLYHFLLTNKWRDEMKYITSNTVKEVYLKLHDWTKQPTVSKLPTFRSSDLLKKFPQSVYRSCCELDDPRFRIPVRAKDFCLLDDFQNGSGAKEPPG